MASQTAGLKAPGASLVAQMERVCLQFGRFRCDPWVGKIPRRRKWQPTPVLLPEKFHGWCNLAGYSPWGHKESDTTERLHFPSCFCAFVMCLYINAYLCFTTPNPTIFNRKSIWI